MPRMRRGIVWSNTNRLSSRSALKYRLSKLIILLKNMVLITVSEENGTESISWFLNLLIWWFHLNNKEKNSRFKKKLKSISVGGYFSVRISAKRWRSYSGKYLIEISLLCISSLQCPFAFVTHLHYTVCVLKSCHYTLDLLPWTWGWKS